MKLSTTSLADFPVKILDVRLVRQIQQAEREHVLRVFLAFLRVVKRFELVELREIFFDVEQLRDERVLAVAVFEGSPGRIFSIAPNTSTISTL